MRGVRLVTPQASGVLYRRWCRCLGTEIDHAGERTAARGDVRAARSMAGFALQPAVSEGTPRVIGPRMLGAEEARDP
jgi:hypothetical protein